MQRKDLETLMKKNQLSSLVIIYNEDDALGEWCHLASGVLCDCDNHRIPLKQSIWGILEFKDGIARRYSMEEALHEVFLRQ